EVTADYVAGGIVWRDRDLVVGFGERGFGEGLGGSGSSEEVRGLDELTLGLECGSALLREVSALSELWIGAIIQGGFLVWRDDALAWRPWREKIGLHVRIVVPGDGGYHRSVAAGFSPGGGGSFSSADAGSSSREGSYYGSFSAKLEVGEGVLVLMMKLSAEVKSVKSTITWFSMRASRVLSGSKAEVISAGRTMISLVVGSLVVSGEISMVVSAEALRVSELRRNERSGDLFRFLPESMKGKLRRRNACRSEWCRSSHVSLPLLPCFSRGP
ncbi:hypothetical protein HID58_072525, partial [Brassica napus]